MVCLRDQDSLAPPDLIRFIEDFASRGGVPAKVSGCMGGANDKYTVFTIANNRWCGNIKRPHKSNGIKVVLDRVRGCLYQKCWDPDCANYRSHPVEVPIELLDSPVQDPKAFSYFTDLNEDSLVEQMDALGL